MARKERIELVTGSLLMVAVIILMLLGLVATRADGALLNLTINDEMEYDGPEMDGQQVIFRYPDDLFDSVFLLSDINDWEPLEMELDQRSEYWTLAIDATDGSYRYQFQVSDGDEEWTAVDPSNSEAATYRDYGWVSLFSVGQKNDKRMVRIKKRFKHSLGPKLSNELERTYGDEDGGASFNRVDGFSVFVEQGTHTGDDMGPALKGRAAYGFASKEWTFTGTMVQPLLKNHRAMLKLEAHTGTDYTDNTGLDEPENSLAAAFFEEDYRDYYHRDGLAGSLVLIPNKKLRIETGLRADEYLSLENHTNWSFADGDFLPNPLVHEGRMRSLFTSIRVGTPLNHFDFEYEKADSEDYGGDFDFSLLKTAVRTRLNLGRSQRIDFQMKYGTALTGALPNQRRFAMGGLGTVRGFAYQTLLDRDPAQALDPTTRSYRGGQRMLQMNVEYGMALGWDGFIDVGEMGEWGDGDVDLLGFDGMLYLFMDSGMAWEDRNADVSLSDTESSIGIGYKFGEDGLRVDMARPLGSGQHDPIFQVRLNRMF